MKTRAFSIIAAMIVLTAASSAHGFTPPHFWSQRFGDTGGDFPSSVATDRSGNVLITGMVEGTVDFGGGNLAGPGSLFVAKYNSAGVHLWSQRFGPGYTNGLSIAADEAENVLITGVLQGTVDFGGGNLTSAGIGDIFVAKFSPSGVHQWSQRFGSTGWDFGYSVAADASGNVLLTGHFSGTVSFGGSALTSAGGYDIFVARYSAAGVHQWSQRFGSTGEDAGHTVAADMSGNVIVTGYFEDTVDLGGGGLASAGGDDIFIAKYNAAGAHQWSRRLGGIGHDFGRGTVDASGNVLVAGSFFDTVDFGGGNLTSAGFADIFVAMYSPAGAHLWSRRYGGTGSEGGSVAVEASGAVLIFSESDGTVDFGGGNLTSAGYNDIFIAKFSPTGTHQWSQRFGDTGYDSGSVAVDASGNAILTGYFSGTVDFGGGSLVSAGSYDIFLAKFGDEPAQPAITSITDIGNDQGRQVKIRFNRSGHDDPESPTPIASYEAYRREDPTPAASSAVRDPAELSARALRADGWTQVGDVAAHGEPVYSIVVPTLGDSTIALGQYFSAFYVRAATDDAFIFHDSPADSGYSLDNLAPGVPVNFAFAAAELSWDESAAKDFDYFTVYGANTDDFGAATVVDYAVMARMDVTASPYVFYFVTATDFAGNESAPARVNTLSGVGGAPKRYVLSVSNFPNPFNPRTTVSYTVPSRGTVTVAIYDVRGVRVATLFNGERTAGAYSVAWDGRTDDAAVAASGVYFARVEHASGTRSKKMMLLK